eukprot:3096560-Rhodomonas_salina.1
MPEVQQTLHGVAHSVRPVVVTQPPSVDLRASVCLGCGRVDLSAALIGCGRVDVRVSACAVLGLI